MSLDFIWDLSISLCIAISFILSDIACIQNKTPWLLDQMHWFGTYSVQLQFPLLQGLDLVHASEEVVSKTLHLQLDDVLVHHLVLCAC